MSQLTNFAENKLADKMRGQAITYPSNWYIALASDASDATFVEITGADLPREAVARSLTAWAGTQGPGTTLASSGTSHATSNNALINLGTAVSARGTANFVGLFDAATGGNCWVWAALPAPIVIGAGDPVSLAAGSLAFTVGLIGGLTNYGANKLIDEFFRGQAYAWPASMFGRLYTAAPNNAGGGTEVAGVTYARAALPSSLTALSGTQGFGSVDPSTGTLGKIVNNADIVWPAPPSGEDWGDVGWVGWGNAASGGNLLFWRAMNGGPKTVNGGGAAPRVAAGLGSWTFA